MDMMVPNSFRWCWLIGFFGWEKSGGFVRAVAGEFKSGICPVHVLLDEIPEGGRQDQAGDLRFPVVQDDLFHICHAGGAG